MSRLTVTLATVIAAGIAVSGCAKNRDVPTDLAPSRMTSIGVNAYLWRAAVDTLSFAPLALFIRVLPRASRRGASRAAIFIQSRAHCALSLWPCCRRMRSFAASATTRAPAPPRNRM